VLDIAPEALDLLLSYPFPGNVRELKHAMEMAVTFCHGEAIASSCLPAEIRESSHAAKGAGGRGSSLESRLKETERQTIVNVLKKTGGKKLAAAKALGISRETLWRKLKEYDVDIDTIEMDIE